MYNMERVSFSGCPGKARAVANLLISTRLRSLLHPALWTHRYDDIMDPQNAPRKAALSALTGSSGTDADPPSEDSDGSDYEAVTSKGTGPNDSSRVQCVPALIPAASGAPWEAESDAERAADDGDYDTVVTFMATDAERQASLVLSAADLDGSPRVSPPPVPSRKEHARAALPRLPADFIDEDRGAGRAGDEAASAYADLTADRAGYEDIGDIVNVSLAVMSRDRAEVRRSGRPAGREPRLRLIRKPPFTSAPSWLVPCTTHQTSSAMLRSAPNSLLPE